MSESSPAPVAAAVRNVIAAHAQAQDDGRTEDVISLYTKDGVLEVSGPPIEGHDALRAAFASWAPTRPQLHLLGNTVITSSTADEATAVSDVTFLLRRSSGWAVQLVGRYQDSLRRVDGDWLLCRRSTSFQT